MTLCTIWGCRNTLKKNQFCGRGGRVPSVQTYGVPCGNTTSVIFSKYHGGGAALVIWSQRKAQIGYLCHLVSNSYIDQKPFYCQVL